MFHSSVNSPILVVARLRAAGRGVAERLVPGGRWISRLLAIAMIPVYVGWNLYWLTQYRVAPSLFWAITGLPCPTTGCTRSLRALLRGEYLESLRYNALTIPICLLLAATLVQLGGQVVHKQKVALWPSLMVLWAAILPLALVLKLLGDSRYW